jgi:hypothetical protein
VRAVEEVVVRAAEEEAVWAEVEDGRAWGLRRSANVRVADIPAHISLDSRVPIRHVLNAEQIW